MESNAKLYIVTFQIPYLLSVSSNCKPELGLCHNVSPNEPNLPCTSTVSIFAIVAGAIFTMSNADLLILYT